jgi:hypothetical protein
MGGDGVKRQTGKVFRRGQSAASGFLEGFSVDVAAVFEAD